MPTKRGVIWRMMHRPQQLWLRRAFFHVHLWSGLALAVYMTVIGVTGSILVFRNEITGQAYRTAFGLPAGIIAPPTEAVLAAVKARYPAAKLTAFRSPTRRDPVETVFLQEGKKNSIVLLHPLTLEPLANLRPEPKWLVWVRSLHADLLGGKTGRLWNGAGAFALLVLCVSGLVLWWRGLSNAIKGLWFKWGSGWKRMNFDLHSAFGFWSVGLLLMWAVTGISFSWPKQYRMSVNALSAVPVNRVPVVKPSRIEVEAQLPKMLATAYATNPGAVMSGVDLRLGPKNPVVVYMTEGPSGDLLHTNYLYFDPASGDKIGEWQRGHPRNLGEWMMWAVVPWHYGNYWGTAIEIIWAFAGLSLPALAFTGVLMYWNRFLRKAMGRADAGFSNLLDRVRYEP